MASALLMHSRLSALSACAETLDIRGRANMVSVAFEIESPSKQFLSDMYDACVLSVSSSNDIDTVAPDSCSPIGRLPAYISPHDSVRQLRATCTAAALHYLSQQDSHVVQQFLDSFFLPLLSCSGSLPDKTCRLQACAGLVALLVSKRLWRQLEQVVSECCRALEAAAAGGGGAVRKLPLPVACMLLVAVVQQLCPPVLATEQPVPASIGARETVGGSELGCASTLRWVLSQMRSTLRPLLSSPSAAARQAALKAMVPITLTSAQACGGSELASTVGDVWQLALELLGGASISGAAITSSVGDTGGSGAVANAWSMSFCTTSQRTALALLVAASEMLRGGSNGLVDVHGCLHFWGILRTCLAFPADVDALERKRALLLLQRLAPPGQMERPGWVLWAALYDILDEFPIHLVAPMWAKIDQLHAPASEFRTEAVVPKSYIPRKKELKQRKADSGGTTAPALAAANGIADEAIVAAAGDTACVDAWSVPQAWQCVLWARALQHGNVQVQRLGMRTFLQRDWRSAEVLRGVPLGFVTGVLLPAVTRDIHYRGGAAEAEVLDAQALAAAWLHGWFGAAAVEHRMEGLLAIRNVVGGSDLSRLGLQQLMRCVAEAARGAAADGQLMRTVTAAGAAAPSEPDASSAAAAFPSAMLAALRGVLVYLTNFTGLPYKRSVWQSVLTVAAAVLPVAVAGISSCLRLLLTLPPTSLEPGGELRNQARSWLLGRFAGVDIDGSAKAAASRPLSRSEVACVSDWLREMLDEYWSSAQLQPANGASAAAVVQLLVLMFDDVEPACETVVGRLRQSLYGMYGRPYLQASDTDCALTLLRELLTALSGHPSVRVPSGTFGKETSPERAAAAAGAGAPPPGAPQSALQHAMVGLMITCCDDLCSAASHSADAFLEADPPTSSGGLDRADASWACVALALVHTARSSDPSAAPATRRITSALLALLSRLCKAPLPPGRHRAVVGGLRAATAATEALRQAVTASPEVRALVAERLDSSALVAAALRDSAAAAATATSVSATVSAAATGSSSSCTDSLTDFSQRLAEVEAAKWPLLDAATALAALISSSSVCGTAGGLRHCLVFEILSQAVAALSEYPEGQVLPLLRCLRRCWLAVAQGSSEMQVAAARALGADVLSSLQQAAAAADSNHETTGAPASPALVALCWPVVRALWNALCATPRRTGPLCAAFVNTALLPCLYVQQSGPQLRALHGPEGPCRWLLSRLLEWGGTSSRFLLLLACQLGSFLPLQPMLVDCYSREIQLLLLWGSRKGSTYDPDGVISDGPEAEELSAVAGPLEPTLVNNAAIGTEVAPRVALLCCIHQMAEDAGCVWPPETVSNVSSAASFAVSANEPKAVVAAAAPCNNAPNHRRPVIIFGDSSDWDDQTTAPSNAPPQRDDGGSFEPMTASMNIAEIVPDADADLADYGAPPPPNPDHPSLLAGRLLWRQLLAFAINDPLMSTDKVRNGSELHRQKVRLWQSLVVLTSFVPRDECGPAVEAMLAQVNGNNPPTVKQYVEAVVAALVLREPSLLQQQLLPLLTNYSRHMTGLGSYVLIAAQVLLHSPLPVQRRELRPLLLSVCPWLMCHGHNVRTYAQLVVWAMLQRFPPESPLWEHSIGDLGYLRHMLDFMHSNADLVRLRRNIGDPILEWSPAAMSHPRRVFASAPDGVCLAGSPIEQSTFEGAPSTLVDRIQAFLVSERHRLRDELADRAAEREFAPQDPNSRLPATAAAAAAAFDGGAVGTVVGSGSSCSAIGDFQRKITPEALMATLTLQGSGTAAAQSWAGGASAGGPLMAHSALAELLQQEEEEETQAVQDWKSSCGSKQLRHDVLLVASLIDKVPNLAGLARTCEVLGAARLVLADLAVTRDPMFTAVSVTAEQWLPMEEVKPAALLAWLERKASEGYTLVGLEQTVESVRLPDYRWPAKVVLVLGREKEGIPPEVLSLLDATLEIPQRGIIRSLNVHVSGAIALYEYVRHMQFQKLPNTIGN